MRSVRIGEDPKAWETVAGLLAWELLYRIEPELYGRLIAGERLHPGILGWLPETIARAVEVGAGLGRLTLDLAPRCESCVAIEPAGSLRFLLERRMKSLTTRRPVHPPRLLRRLFRCPASWANLTVTCSAFSCEASHGGDVGLAELERVTAPGGLVVIIWPPSDRAWLECRGFTYEDFPEETVVEFASLEEAVEIASIFYPHAVDRIAERGSPVVPFEVLGMPDPSVARLAKGADGADCSFEFAGFGDNW